MLDFISGLDFTVIKVGGMIISGLAGVVMSWLSKRSVNYRKIDKRMAVAVLLFFFYMNIVAFVLGFGLGIVIEFGEFNSVMPLMPYVLIFSAINILVCWLWLFRTKRVKEMFDKAKVVGKRLFYMLHWVTAVSVVLGYIYSAFLLMGEGGFFFGVISAVSWIITAWWFTLMAMLVYATSKYVYSQMKITLVDGEVIEYSCSPQMCRVHKNYIRLLRRDEKGAIVYERHINEGSVKQIEYS